jgi:hypothetical protein
VTFDRVIMNRITERHRWATAGGWPRLGLLSSGLWVALVLVMALASPDPGQNYVAYMLIGPTIVLLGLGCTAGLVSRSHPPARGDDGQVANGMSVRAEQPALWWASMALGFAAIVCAFAFQWRADGTDILRQSVRLAGSLIAIAVVALVAYRMIRPKTAASRAQFLLATAFAGGAFVLWQAVDDTQRVTTERPASAAVETKAPRDTRVAERAKSSTKPRRPAASKAVEPSAPAQVAETSATLADALRKNNERYAALSSKWDLDVGALQFELMLTPDTLTSARGRNLNRDRLRKFEALLADYLIQLDAVQRDYKGDVLAIDIPPEQRDDFIKDFERSFDASVAETKELNAAFERVELEISNTILKITDLMEQEEDAVTVDGRRLLFQHDEAAEEYNALLKALEKTTAEEGVIMDKSSEAFRKRADSIETAAVR